METIRWILYFALGFFVMRLAHTIYNALRK